jgi:FMN phosphatase YigB (HAD superfamily)
MMISVVFFDVGDTLINEARLWNAWAVYLGVPADEFRSALVKVIAGGEHHQKVFERFRPGFDLVSARQERSSYGDFDVFDASDVYPDALPCLQRLRELGYVVGIAGNQPREAHEALKRVGFEACSRSYSGKIRRTDCQGCPVGTAALTRLLKDSTRM